MKIVHPIKDPNNFSILLTCPMCLKELNQKRIDASIKLLEDKNTKELIVKKFKKKEDNEYYTVTCPHCNRFTIHYRNDIPTWKWAEKINEEVIDYEGIKQIGTNTKEDKDIEGEIEECKRD